jgi:hypothetical protein
MWFGMLVVWIPSLSAVAGGKAEEDAHFHKEEGLS